MRFHLDEQVDPAIAEGLRHRGIDVTTSQSAGLLSAPDKDHVAFALEEQRVIFTNDRDFLRIHSRGGAHCGIVYSPPQAKSIGEIIRFLGLMHDCLAADEMHGQVEYL